MDIILGTAIGIVLAVIVATLILRRSATPAAPLADPALIASLEQRIAQETARAAELEARLHAASAQAAVAGERGQRIGTLEQQLRERDAAMSTLREQSALIERRAAEAAARAHEKEQALGAQIAQLQAAEKRLATEFENVANRIFAQKQQQFGEQSRQDLEALLKPFREQIDGFRTKVEEAYNVEQRERHVLKTEISALRELNQRINAEAENLTRALKGDNKTQGNWGEMILEGILTSVGLAEGREYETQAEHQHEEGRKHRPDVIVHLPEGKDVVIDSKVSLVDWERVVGADDDAREAALDAHVLSLRAHIRGLGDKNYQQLEGVRSLDYVLMFVPIEAAFHAAVAHEPKLIEQALEKNIMLVSPTTLLLALRTIHNLWRYEYQNRNALKISEVAGKMYDKLAGFVADMDDIKAALEKADRSWDAARNKLVDGKGNVIRQAQKVVDLGVKATKKIDREWTDRALGTSADEEDATAGG